MKVLGIIPARYQSTRFPGKPLADIAGISMIQRVYERASLAESLSAVVVATDDQRIADHVRSFGGNVALTRSNHPSGTDRCAQISQESNVEHDVVINIQGDEPLIHPDQINAVAKLFEDAHCEIGTLAGKLDAVDHLDDPNKVKIALNSSGFALYFSRSPIPFIRGVEKREWLQKQDFFQHIGIYGYRKTSLQKISQLPVGLLEKAESLEQLRWLEHGLRIKVGQTNHPSIGVDHPDDIQRILKLLQEQA